jgi:hypothetical protein
MKIKKKTFSTSVLEWFFPSIANCKNLKIQNSTSPGVQVCEESLYRFYSLQSTQFVIYEVNIQVESNSKNSQTSVLLPNNYTLSRNFDEISCCKDEVSWIFPDATFRNHPNYGTYTNQCCHGAKVALFNFNVLICCLWKRIFNDFFRMRTERWATFPQTQILHFARKIQQLQYMHC